MNMVATEELEERLKKLLVRLSNLQEGKQLGTMVQIMEDLLSLANTDGCGKTWFCLFINSIVRGFVLFFSKCSISYYFSLPLNLCKKHRVTFGLQEARRNILFLAMLYIFEIVELYDLFLYDELICFQQLNSLKTKRHTCHC